MAFGVINQQWSHTAAIMQTLVAINWTQDNGPPPSAAHFHPFADEPPPPAPAEATPELLMSIGFRPVEEVKNGR